MALGSDISLLLMDGSRQTSIATRTRKQHNGSTWRGLEI